MLSLACGRAAFLHCLHARAAKTALQVEKLLEQYENIAVELPEAAALSKKHAAATAWAGEAQAVLDHGRQFADEDASMLEVCILSAATSHAWCQARRSHHAQFCWLRVCSFKP